MKPYRVLSFVLLAGVVGLAVGKAQEVVPESIPNWPAPLFWSPPARLRPDQAAAQGEKNGSRRLQIEANLTGPLPYVAVQPCRQYNSLLNTSLPQGFDRGVTLTGGPCGIPVGAAAVSVNITVFNITGAGGNGVFKVDIVSPPQTAWINYPPTETQRSNAGVVALTSIGQIIVQVAQGAGQVDFIVDVNGYYAGGVVTSVTPGTGLTGGGTGDVTVGISPGGVTATELATNAVTSSKLAANAVTSGAIASGQVVKSLNGATDTVTITGTGGASVNTAGNSITVSAPGVVPPGGFILGNPGDTTLIGAGFTELGPSNQDGWKAVRAPSFTVGLTGLNAVWTGTRMIIWGGSVSGSILNSGGQYDPVTDTWTPTTTTGAPSPRAGHTSVWTGAKMIVWGGSFDGFSVLASGGQYDPVADSWIATATTGAPSGRVSHTAVWIGDKMIVWGGYNASGNYFDTGALYDPLVNSWSPTSTIGAPSPRNVHTAVWTGSKMIVWGGGNPSGSLNTGGRYDPATDSWAATTTVGAPTARATHSMVWSGARMIVWGGVDNPLPTYSNTGGRYDPVADSWTATTTTGAPSARGGHTAVSTEAKMIVWGGSAGAGPTYFNTGGQYDPAADSWIPTTTAGAPAPRASHTAIWTGNRMIVWGGNAPFGPFNNGGVWNYLSLYLKN